MSQADILCTRPAVLADASASTEIYNQGVEDWVGTFQNELQTVGKIEAWF